MNIKQLIQDDEGVSPVIGVILMVAITVILAAVIAAFVLGLGGSSNETPQASFDFELTEGTSSSTGQLDITAQSGDTIDADNLELTVGGQSLTDNSGVDEGSSSSFSGDVSAGSTATIVFADNNDAQGETVNVVWSSSDGEDSSILADFDIPDDATLENTST